MNGKDLMLETETGAIRGRWRRTLRPQSRGSAAPAWADRPAGFTAASPRVFSRRDLLAGVDFLRSPGAARVILAGHSFGGPAINAALADPRNRRRWTLENA